MEEIDMKVLYFLSKFEKLLVGNNSGSISLHVLANYRIPILQMFLYSPF